MPDIEIWGILPMRSSEMHADHAICSFRASSPCQALFTSVTAFLCMHACRMFVYQSGTAHILP